MITSNYEAEYKTLPFLKIRFIILVVKQLFVQFHSKAVLTFWIYFVLLLKVVSNDWAAKST